MPPLQWRGNKLISSKIGNNADILDSHSDGESDDVCGTCGNAISTLILCSCDGAFCAVCLTKHLKKFNRHYPLSENHREAQISRAWATDSLNKCLPRSEDSRKKSIEKDGANKWFGLSLHRSGPVPVACIVETRRFSTLMEDSLHCAPGRLRHQYPSIISFVGEAGVGKSTLSKS